MIYTPLTNEAMRVAFAAHAGQLDRGDVPYVLHPVHVAEQMDDEISCAVALLHDVVEDTDVTLEDLAKTFPPEVVENVALLTHDESVDYFDYVRAIVGHPIAEKVKRADLDHNSDQTRTLSAKGDDPKVLAWLEEKQRRYSRAYAILDGAEKSL